MAFSAGPAADVRQGETYRGDERIISVNLTYSNHYLNKALIMKKDRKKFNLHELAGQVEKMSRPEQESSAGGDYYYNEQGMFLGQRGTGSQLKVIADNDFLIGQCAGEEYLNRNGAYDFSQASMSGQMRIVSAIAGQPCEVYYNSSDYNESGHTVTTRNGSNVTSYIGINLYGTAVRSGNY